MTTDKPTIEFVNDWEPLEEAVAELKELQDAHAECDADYCDSLWLRDFTPIVDYVPRLLTQYASLLELSFALTEGWDQYAAVQAPTGLYLPEHR